MAAEVIFRQISDVEPVATSHAVGLKRVLLSASETTSAVTQIACTTMQAGESVGEHVHPTMDEHYIFESGRGQMFIDGVAYDCLPGSYLLVPAAFRHGLTVLEDMKFITIGVAYDK